MYTTRNFKSKVELKRAVETWKLTGENPVTYFQPNDMGVSPLPRDGTIYLEGPHYPEPHKWYAQAEVKDGVIVKVK